MLYRFMDDASLEAWETSSERAWWIASAVGLVEDREQLRRTGIENWFDEPTSVEVIAAASAAPTTPPRWKQMVAIFLVFFPLSLLVNLTLGPVTAQWPFVLRILTTIVVLTPIMTYVGLPLVTRALRPWLTASRRG